MIVQLRQAWHDRTVEPEIGRAARQVTAWSILRSCAVLRAYCRVTPRIAVEDDAPVQPHEAGLIAIAQAIAAGDRDLAAAKAQWLVRRDGIDRLLRALTPAACHNERGLSLRAN